MGKIITASAMILTLFFMSKAFAIEELSIVGQSNEDYSGFQLNVKKNISNKGCQVEHGKNPVYKIEILNAAGKIQKTLYVDSVLQKERCLDSPDGKLNCFKTRFFCVKAKKPTEIQTIRIFKDGSILKEVKI